MSDLLKIQTDYLSALRQGNKTGAHQVVMNALNGGYSVKDVYLHIIEPVQQQLGDLWAHGILTVAEEHRATQITVTELARLRSLFVSPSPLNLSAIICAIDPEQHVVGAQMVADFLEAAGWEVDFLAGLVPADQLSIFVESRKPDILGLSVTMQEHLSDARKAIELVRTLEKAPKVIVGGQAFKKDGTLFLNIGADGYGINADDSVARALRLCRKNLVESPTQAFLKTVGLRVRAARVGRGLTQKQLAEKAGVARTFLSGVENGRDNLSLASFARIAEALGLDPDDLMHN